jgi:hypothetical protein
MYLVWGDQSRVNHDIMPNQRLCEAAGRSYAGQSITNPNIHVGYVCIKLETRQ